MFLLLQRKMKYAMQPIELKTFINLKTFQVLKNIFVYYK